jgi:hypothetical protein
MLGRAMVMGLPGGVDPSSHVTARVIEAFVTETLPSVLAGFRAPTRYPAAIDSPDAILRFPSMWDGPMVVVFVQPDPASAEPP